LIREIIQLWAESDTLSGLKAKIHELPKELHDLYSTKSFKFSVQSFGRSITMEEQVSRIEYVECGKSVDTDYFVRDNL
jgi:hypothetical protein